MRVAADSTDVSVIVRIVDSTDGTPETGVTSATGGLALGYWREGAASFVGLTESDLATLDAAHSDGGLLHINSGHYRLDIPDAAFATGVDRVLIGGEATDMVVIGQVVEIGPVIANTVQVEGADATDQIRDAVVDDATRIDASQLNTNLDAAVSSRSSHSAADVRTEMDANSTRLTNIVGDTNELQTDFVDGGRLDLLIDAIKAKTDNLPADPADDSDIDAQLAAIAAYIDTEVAAIKAKTDNLPAAPAATGDIPTTADILAMVVEGSLTFVQAQRIMLAALAGKSTGGGTTSLAFRDQADTKDRIDATVNEDGNRTAVTVDGT